MKIVVHCIGLPESDIRYLKTIKQGSARTSVKTDGDLTTLTATGIYDDLVNIIIQVTCVKNFEVHFS